MALNLSPALTGILAKLNGEKASVVASYLTKIYIASSQSAWTYTNLTGLLSLVIDRGQGGAYFLRLFHPETLELIFETELYYNFVLLNDYKDKIPAFYYFEVSFGFIGLQFVSEDQAEAFRKKLPSNHPKMEEKELKKIYKEKVEKKSEGFFSKAKNFLFGDKSEKKEDISKPKNVQQMMSIKFDNTKGTFDLQSMTPEMKKIFKNAGIEKKDLLDKDLAPILFEKILSELNKAEPAPLPEVKQEAKPEIKKETTASAPVKTNNPPPPPPPPGINLNIPPPPMINLNIPKAPAINININNPASVTKEEKKTNPTPKPAPEGDRGDLLKQIRDGINLKTVEKNEKDNNMLAVKMDNISKKVEQSLTLTLAQAIAERRKQITKNDYSSDEASPWSDDD